MTARNYLDATGLHLETYDDIVTYLESQYRVIYGNDINLDSNSPDGQKIGMLAQSKIDMLNCITSVYNSFAVGRAIGVALKQRVAINGVVPKGATYTRTNVTITTDRVLELPGLDTNPTNPYAVKDDAGNQFFLEETSTTGIGANVLEFRAEKSGLVSTTPDTITKAVTVVLGVTAINNPDSALETGQDEEKDPQLRARQQASVSLPAAGWLPAMRAALLAVPDVLDAQVYENDTDSSDARGVDPHSMWAIVDGGDSAAIADVIYRKRNGGCGMTGSQTVTLTQVNGVAFTVKFDRPVYANLYLAASLTSVDPAHTVDGTWLANQVLAEFVYKIYQPADFTAITAFIKELDPLAVLVAGGVSGNGSEFYNFLYPTTVQKRWILSLNRIDFVVV
jgi:uncharacterized phage protein gp47/JayE